MKAILALLVLLPGCATRVYYPNGRKAVETYADASEFHFTGPGTELQATGLNHSNHTRVATNGITSAMTALGAAAAGLK